MKSIEQVKLENPHANVFTLCQFCDDVNAGYFIPYDGIGFFHDGEKRTDVCVWDESLTPDDIANYEYVLWFNK